MAGSTFQPPIHLDPNQDPAQQVAFINQNFQSLASTLETNSFRVVDTINGTFPAVTVAGNTGGWALANNINTIPHNLGITPLPFGTFFDGTTYIQLPDTKLNGNSTTPYWEQWRVRVDGTNVYLDHYITIFNQPTGTNLTSPAVTAIILLLQQVAN